MDLQFGKYQGIPITTVIKEHPGYIIWLANQDWIDYGLADSIDTFKKRIIMPYGKYQGECINVLQNTEPEYVDWLFKGLRKTLSKGITI